MEKIIYPRFLLVKDNFYSDPQKVYQTALQAKFYEPEGYTGSLSTSVYHEKGVKNKLEKILGIKITRWDTDPGEENGVFYQALAQGKKKEIPGVHSDQPYNDITVVVYLTPGIPFHCGTSLWMHKRTGLIDPPTRADARRLKMKFKKLVDLFEDDAWTRSKWIEIDRAGYRPNRMVAYPSGVLHSATNHYGGHLENGRIYQTFRIGVDWKTFRMNKA
jgi:hypothetical protein